jgi:hypothetical protein
MTLPRTVARRRRISIGIRLLAMLALSAGVAAQDALLLKLQRIAGLTAAPPARDAGEAVASGNIWIVPADRGAPKALTLDGGYTSPIFSPDGRVYALKGDTLVRLPQETGAGVAVHKVPRAVKLIGFDASAPDDLVVLLDAAAGSSPLGVLSVGSGRLTPLPVDPASEEQRRMLAQVRAPERTYGTTSVYTRAPQPGAASRATSSSDVYIRVGGAQPRNVSACRGVRCGQAALSPDGRSVVFIKASR